jgi:hypothetical protein
MSNPYESPQFAGKLDIPFGNDREKVRRVAQYQRYVIFALLANLGLYILALGLQGGGFRAAGAVAALLFFVVALCGAISVFLLAKEVFPLVAAILMLPLMCVPCVSLLVLLIVNGRATSFLKEHGVPVGFFGANPDAI